MSHKLDDAQIWLPSEFLTEEDIVMDSYGVLGSSRFRFTPEFSTNHGTFTPSTGSSSPVESMFCSTETQSDEGDSLGSELTQLLTLLHEKKGFELSGTQMSTLPGFRNGSGRSIMPSNGSLNGSFQVPSHATAPSGGNDDAWDLIYKATGQAAMLKNNGGCGGAPNPGHLGPQRILTIPASQKPSIPSPLYRNQLMKNENLFEQEMWNNRKENNNGLMYEQIYRRRAMVSDGLAGGFQLKNQQQGAKTGLHLTDGYGFGYGSGARGGKNERVGTGVFLPRRYGSTIDSTGNFCSAGRPRNKLGSTTVDLQSKRNPALKKLNNPTGVLTSPSQLGVSRNIVGANACPSQLGVSRSIVGANETSLARRAALLTLQRAFLEGGAEAVAAINHDNVCLPQEWTY